MRRHIATLSHRNGVVGVGLALVVLAAAVAVTIGSAVATTAVSSGGSSGGRPVAASAAASAAQDGAEVDTGAAEGYQDPVPYGATSTAPVEVTAARVAVPTIGVDSALEALAIDPASGALDPPAAWMSAGWYAEGTVPGEVGPAVIAGHLDSVTAPAVFARLGELVSGDEILVTLSDGSVVTFLVDSLLQAPKAAFPTAAVYGPTPVPQLRLITCDGDFDPATGHYVDNLVVFASQRS